MSVTQIKAMIETQSKMMQTIQKDQQRLLSLESTIKDLKLENSASQKQLAINADVSTKLDKLMKIQLQQKQFDESAIMNRSMNKTASEIGIQTLPDLNLTMLEKAEKESFQYSDKETERMGSLRRIKEVESSDQQSNFDPKRQSNMSSATFKK